MKKKIYKKYYSDDKPKPTRADFITQKTKLEISDLVRIPRRKIQGYEKGFTPNWTKEIFKIREIKPGNPITYYLSDAKNHHIQGAFYRQELQKSKYPFMAWMGDTKPRTKENVSLGMEAVAKEAKRQKEKKQRQRDRKKEEKKGKGLEISERVKNLPITTLTNFDLLNVCKDLKGWRGVFSRDALPKNPKIYECGILNLDDTDGPGTHWVAWHRNKKNKYYFDSYGLPPPLEMRKYLKSPIFYSSDQIQDPNSVICGHLCIYVLEKLNKGYDLFPVVSYLMDLKEKGAF